MHPDSSTYFEAHELQAFREALALLWQKRPGLFKRPFSTPLVDESQFLRLLLGWADDVRAGRREGEVATIDAGALPDGDTTLRGLEERLDACWKGDWYAYVPDGVQQLDGDLWERFIELGKVMIELNGGLPPGGFKLDMFFGRYGRTPTGIHLDSSDNLAFVTRGPKRMLFWQRERFEPLFRTPPGDPSHEGALTGRYEDHLAGAIEIIAEAGDVIYWPKEFWHIGVSGGDWSGMITAPMWWRGRPKTIATQVLNRTLELPGETQPVPMDLAKAADAALVMPPALEQLVTSVKAQVENNLDRTARLHWARFVTAYGFTTLPALADRPSLTRASRVRVKHVVAAIPLGAIAVVAVGRYTVVALPSLAELPHVLAVGTEHEVGNLLERFAAGDVGDEAALVDVLADLVTFRALVVVSSTSA